VIGFEEELENHEIKKNKRRVNTKSIDAKIQTKKKFGMNFIIYNKFNKDFNSFCELIENMNFYFGQILTDSGLDKSNNLNDSQVIIDNTGMELEGIIKKYYKTYNEIKDRIEVYVEDLHKAFESIDCDIRDLMYFFRLLPRFHLIYKKIYEKLKDQNDSVIEYYKEKIVEILYNWQNYNGETFKYFSMMIFWTIQAESLFELPFSITRNKDFKYTMIVRSVEVWLELTSFAQNFQMNSDLMLDNYVNIYDELKIVFEGLESYMNLKIPFKIPEIERSSFAGNIFALVSLIFVFVLF
jgi:hypothetical protein